MRIKTLFSDECCSFSGTFSLLFLKPDSIATAVKLEVLFLFVRLPSHSLPRLPASLGGRSQTTPELLPRLSMHGLCAIVTKSDSHFFSFISFNQQIRFQIKGTFPHSGQALGDAFGARKGSAFVLMGLPQSYHSCVWWRSCFMPVLLLTDYPLVRSVDIMKLNRTFLTHCFAAAVAITDHSLDDHRSSDLLFESRFVFDAVNATFWSIWFWTELSCGG